MLKCTFCLKEKPDTREFFFVNKKSARGFAHVCKKCYSSSGYKQRNKITHKPKNYWSNYNNCLNAAKQFRYLDDFQRECHYAYSTGLKMNFLDRLIVEAPLIRKQLKRGSVTKETCVKAANTCKSRKEFSDSYGSHYKKAWQEGWLDDICSHMIPLNNLNLRGIYAFEYPDKSVYVGLTFNYEKRYSYHMSKNKTLMEKQAKGGQVFKKFNEFFLANIAQKKEAETIEWYRLNGWTILNKAKAGALGGRRKMWTKDALINEAKKYKFKSDFMKSSGGAYTEAHKLGIIDEICSHMERKPLQSKWTAFLIANEAKKYTNISSFIQGSYGAYRRAKKLGIIDEVCKHMEKKLRKWTNEDLINEAKKYDTFKDFRKNSASAYSTSHKRGLIKEITSHWSRQNEKWDKQELIEIAKQYNTLKAFIDGNGTAYRACYRLGFLDEARAHMTYKKYKLTK